MKIIQPPEGYRGFNLLGRKFNRLKVLSFGGYRVWSTKTVPVPQWVCRCDCGNTSTHKSSSLLANEVMSCGCYKREVEKGRVTRLTHGMARHGRVHPLYRRHQAILNRLSNPSMKGYHRYGGRGIKICAGFRDFQVFYNTIMPTWWVGGTIDRRNNNGHYSCGKCKECKRRGWTMNLRWATRSQQCRNKENNIWVRWRGKRKLLIEWSEETGIEYHTLYWRIVKQKWPLRKAFGTPVR